MKTNKELLQDIITKHGDGKLLQDHMLKTIESRTEGFAYKALTMFLSNNGRNIADTLQMAIFQLEMIKETRGRT